MEANRKMRKGFIKGKLVMSLYRATGQPYTNIKPKPSYAVPFFVNQQAADHQAPKINIHPQPPKPKQLSSTTTTTTTTTTIVNQEKVNPQPKPKVSFLIPAVTESKYGKFDNPYGGGVGDEGVDAKAASYISCVQERFRLERINSERTRAAAPDLQ